MHIKNEKEQHFVHVFVHDSGLNLVLLRNATFRAQSMQSVDFYASSEEGGFEEGGGKPGAKINEFQAAWNVTNAIQVINLED